MFNAPTKDVLVDNKDKDKDLINRERKYGNLTSLGLQLAAGIIVFFLLGYFIDQKRGEDKVAFTIAGMILGFCYGGYEIWRLLKRINEDDN